MALTAKSRNPRRTVLQGVKAGRSILSDTFKDWNQAQTLVDRDYMGGVKRGLADTEKVENQPDSWKTLNSTGEALIELGEMYRKYADANLKRLNGEEVDMAEFEDSGTESTDDAPLPE